MALEFSVFFLSTETRGSVCVATSTKQTASLSNVRNTYRLIYQEQSVGSKVASDQLIVCSPGTRYRVNVEVTRKGKGKFTLEQSTKAQRGSRVIAQLFLQPRH
jgi:hypothetical protein